MQVLEVGDFDVAGGEVADVRFEGCGRGGVFGGEGGAVGEEGWVVPLGGEDGGEGGEGVGELRVRCCLVPSFAFLRSFVSDIS